MENLKISLQVVTPLFLSMSFGYFLKRIGVLEEEILSKLNEIIFKAFFPILMFNNIYKTEIASVIDIGLIVYAVIFIILLVMFLIWFIPLIEPDNSRRGVLIQAVYRSNFIIFGLSMVTSMYGEKNTAVVTILVAVIVPLFNVLAVIVLEMFRSSTINISRVMVSVAKNPLILGALCGLAVSVLGIPISNVIGNTISEFASVTTPLSLIVLGATFRFSSFKKLLPQLTIGVLGKLVIVPAIGIPIAVWLGFRGVALMGLLAMMASPIAISSFPMAKQMQGDGELAAQLVVYTSAFSVITIFVWIFVLKHLSLL